jgi:hypothetical protein
MLPEREIARVLTALRRAIRARGLNFAEMDRRLGWPQSSTSLLLRGTPRARLDHVYSILQVLGLPPGDFWSSVYGAGPVLDPALTREMFAHVERAAEIADELRRLERHPVAPARYQDEGDEDA